MKKNFYRAFEEKYRGSRERIIGRLEFYRPFLEPLVKIYGCVPTIDLGCGRGEWLELLISAGLEAHGVDLDEGMLQSCIDYGLPAEKGEAIEKLKSLPAESQAIVSAFHFVEHIPFDSLQQLVSEAKRVLLPGGLLILETPNPENIKVATCNFYLDPTHQKPIPPLLLSFVAEYEGFERVKIARLQEPPHLLEKKDLNLTDVLEGASPDYCVIAQKTADQSILMIFNEMFSREYGLTIQKISSDYDAQIVRGIAEKTMNDLLQNELASAKTRIEALSGEAALARGLSDSLKQEIAAKDQEIISLRGDLTQAKTLHSQAESELAKKKQELQDIHQASHNHWLLAQDRKKQLLTILSGACWRITAPIRWCGDNLQVQKRTVKAFIKDGMLKRAGRYIEQNPGIKSRIQAFLYRYPKCHERLLSVWQRIHVEENFNQKLFVGLQDGTKNNPGINSKSTFESNNPLIHDARPRILQLTNYAVENPNHGGKMRAYNIRESLRKHFNVQTLSIEVAEHEFIQDFTIGIRAHDLYSLIGDGNLSDWGSAFYILKNQRTWESVFKIAFEYDPDAILLEQPFLWPIYQKLKEDGALRKDCLLINSTHNNEVELKESIYNKIFSSEEAAQKLSIVKKLESEAAVAADLSIAVSEQDRNYLDSLSPRKKILLYKNGHEGIKTTKKIGDWRDRFANSEKNFVVVGSWHMPNILGLKRLVDAGLLSLDSKKIKLWVFGGMGPGLLSTFSLTLGESSPLEIIGQAPSDDIDSAIMASSGVILPIWDGSGSNLKTAQALLSGKTIIGTNFAFRGLEAYATESGVNITNDPAALLSAMSTVDISAPHHRPQAVDDLRWGNLLKNLPQDVANAMGYSIARREMAARLFFDITTLVRWKGHPTGIARVISNLGSAMLAAYPEMQFTIFCRESRKFHHYDINQNKQGEDIRIDPHNIILSAGANWDDEGFEDAILDSKKNGAKYAQLYYDAIPCILPHSFGPGFADKFSLWLQKSISLSDVIFSISENTRKDLIRFSNDKSINIDKITVIRLGDSIKSKTRSNYNSDKKENSNFGEFILSVGTLEYRKNHIVLLNAYRLLLQSGIRNIPKLVIVGGQGWMDSEITFQVQNDKTIREYIHVVSGISDTELENLYKECLFTVYPALYEGWGLPVTESLGYGKICITSRLSSMVEIAPDLTPFANPYMP
jgi:O-antigen chain-terminating methyltransferase